jgi:Mg2+/Co2+ transporter CorB
VLILFVSEIIPKNIGVAYRRELQVYIVYPLWFIRLAMWPFSTIAKYSIRVMLPKDEQKGDGAEEEEEIRLLAEKRAEEGSLTESEADMISNALSLDDVRVSDLMTPRTVVTFLDESQTVGEVNAGFKVIPFARIRLPREHRRRGGPRPPPRHHAGLRRRPRRYADWRLDGRHPFHPRDGQRPGRPAAFPLATPAVGLGGG